MAKSQSSRSADETDDCLAQSCHIRVSKSSEVIGCTSSLMDSFQHSGLTNAASDHNVAAASSKGKKARRKGRRKEARTSVGELLETPLLSLNG